MILHHASPLHRELIVEQIWPGINPERANVNFRNTATRLRQAFAQALDNRIPKHAIFVFRNKRYQILEGVKIQLDIEDCSALLKAADRLEAPDSRAELISQAMALYRGDFLPEIYDAWADPLRRGLRENILNHLHWLAGHTMRTGNYPACLSVCDKYLSMDPYSEEITCLCMQALARMGQTTSIKNRYEQLKRKLEKELGTKPSDQTQELYQALTGGAPGR